MVEVGVCHAAYLPAAAGVVVVVSSLASWPHSVGAAVDLYSCGMYTPPAAGRIFYDSTHLSGLESAHLCPGTAHMSVCIMKKYN